MDLGLKDVHVLVTGANGGIGIETVRLYLDLGAKVTAHYNSSAQTLNELQQTTEYSSNLQIAQANLSSESDVINMFDFISKQTFGPVQVAVVNHGHWPQQDAPVVRMSLDQWNGTLGNNLTSCFLVCREYLKALEAASAEVKDKASIVFVGSTAGKYGEAGHADYAATKSALMYGLTMTLKNEIVKIAPKGRVNTVAPGWTKTPLATEALKDHRIVYSALASTPLKKVATARDVANQIVVLSSGTVSGHVTGQCLMVEGGMEGRLLNRQDEIALPV